MTYVILDADDVVQQVSGTPFHGEVEAPLRLVETDAEAYPGHVLRSDDVHVVPTKAALLRVAHQAAADADAAPIVVRKKSIAPHGISHARTVAGYKASTPVRGHDGTWHDADLDWLDEAAEAHAHRTHAVWTALRETEEKIASGEITTFAEVEDAMRVVE